jgi:ketosteroid isomerase-like protein
VPRLADLKISAILAVVAVSALMAQPPRPLPQALTQMIDAERAFAARALVVGWKQAFLEYFAEEAVGFDGGVGRAKEQIRKNPDPPPDLQLIWEPRYGDISGSGDLGYLTGPVRNVRKSRENGRPRHSNYASIWKRQPDGTFKVLLDFGVNTPGPVPFPAGFTRAPGSRFSGDYDDTTPPLSAADGILNSGLRTGQADAYRGTQPPYSAIDSRFAEAARAGDLGYTWGSYVVGPAAKPRERGFYIRIWQRERNGQWNVVLDALQPAQG